LVGRCCCLSSEAASIMTRFEDLMRKYLRKLAPLMSKVGLSYDVGQSFERTERGFASRLLNFVGKLNAKFYFGERDLYRYYLYIFQAFYTFFMKGERGLYRCYRSLVRSLLSLQVELEDALSFSSLYMNLLLVFALVLMVVWAWTS